MASSFEINSTRPSVGETIVTIVRDHIDYRKQIFKLAGSDLRRTYRASALGWSWAIIKPLVTIFVYWFAFAVGLRRGGDIEGYPFVLWLISGIVPWFYMSEMLTLGTECILRNRYLVTKMKYPVSTIPTFTSISKFSVHLILMMITILIFVITGNELTIYLVQLPFYMLCNFLFFTGWAMFAAPIAAISTDFSNLVKSRQKDFVCPPLVRKNFAPLFPMLRRHARKFLPFRFPPRRLRTLRTREQGDFLPYPPASNTLKKRRQKSLPS